LFLDMLIGEHQLRLLTGMARAVKREQIDETVQLATKVFLRGCTAPVGAMRIIRGSAVLNASVVLRHVCPSNTEPKRRESTP
jgi:hypothetical protein